MKTEAYIAKELPLVSTPSEFTPEQADVLRRLEAYPHLTFNLHSTGSREAQSPSPHEPHDEG